MLRRILTYGTVAGAIVGVPLCGLTITMNGHVLTSYGAIIGYTLMLIALSTVFVAIKRHRDEDFVWRWTWQRSWSSSWPVSGSVPAIRRPPCASARAISPNRSSRPR